MARRLIGCALLVVCAVASSAELPWSDIENRIQYAYYTEDARALRSLVASLDAAPSGDVLRSYYSALANYRITQLSLATKREEAKVAGERCVARLDEALKRRSDFADALALQSACRALLTNLRLVRMPFTASRISHQIDRALQLAPGNPRVLLIDALGDLNRAHVSDADRDRAISKLQNAVSAFEMERRGVEVLPGWGAPDAYTVLARSYLEKGDPIAARGALEHALLIAPEFALARRMLTRITSG